MHWRLLRSVQGAAGRAQRDHHRSSTARQQALRGIGDGRIDRQLHQETNLRFVGRQHIRDPHQRIGQWLRGRRVQDRGGPRLARDDKSALGHISATSRGLMAPQCGLAPGFIAIVGASLIESFDTCRSVRLRVGALPQTPTGLLGYAFNWSPEGVVNEYLNDCEVLEEGVRKWVSSMEWRETLYVDGIQLEAFTTSGGLGTMCETYEGRVANIDYKTIRYPGHMDLMNFFFHELLMRERRELAGEILTNAKPPVSNDVVYVHVSAEGHIDQHLRRLEFVRSYRPKTVAGQERTAIAWTTAGSVAAVIEMVRAGTLPSTGLLKQEHISLDHFLATPTGRLFAE